MSLEYEDVDLDGANCQAFLSILEHEASRILNLSSHLGHLFLIPRP